MDPIEEINCILRTRKIASEDVSGFDEKEQHNWYFFDLTQGSTNFGIDVCKECTIYFGDWHHHYDIESEWDEFIQTLNDIFDNKLCSIGSYIGSIEQKNIMGAMLAKSEDVSEKYIIDEFGTERVVRVCFFNPSLNKEYRV